MDPHCLHIWPRRYFMMMGLANQDGGFTGTLFMPHEGEFSLRQHHRRAGPDALLREHFADAIPMLPDLAEQYFRNPQSNLAIIRCNPWYQRDKVALIGDAAHAIVPFYGEGMNAGYEDCKVLNDLLNEHGDDNWAIVLRLRHAARKPNGDAIADLSLRNFVEMRDLVADPRFILRKKIEGPPASEAPRQVAAALQPGEVQRHRLQGRVGRRLAP
jgi:kynurenine 3-monooxygenase